MSIFHSISQYTKNQIIIGILRCCIVSIFILPQLVWGQYKLAQISNENGLSDNTVQCLIKDHLGFIWIGTQNGLNRFDGRNMLIYKHHNLDTTSLSNNSILKIVEDLNGNLWLATEKNGLDFWDRNTNKFQNITFQKSLDILDLALDNNQKLYIATSQGLKVVDISTKNSITFAPQGEQGSESELLKNSFIYSLHFHSKTGVLWIGASNGLYSLHIAKNLLTLHQITKKKSNANKSKSPFNLPIGLSTEDVFKVLGVDNEYVWYSSSQGGLQKLDLSTQELEQYSYNKRSINNLSDNLITSLLEDEQNKIWIGTSDGLNLFRKQTNDFENFNQEFSNTGILNNQILCLLDDLEGNIWVGTKGNGLLKITKDDFAIKTQQCFAGKYCLSDEKVESIYQTKDGVLWIGMRTGGLHSWNFSNNQWQHFQYKSQTTKGLSENFIKSMVEGEDSKLWIATDNKGLCIFDRKTQQFQYITYSSKSKNNQIHSNQLFCLLKTQQGDIWVGSDAGIDRMRFQNGSYRFQYCYQEAKDSLSLGLTSNKIRAMAEDDDGFVWIGTSGGGLNRLDPNTGMTLVFQHSENDEFSLSDDYVSSIHIDDNGRIWVGTLNGLNVLDLSNYKFTRYSEKDGMPSRVILGMQEDGIGHLWLTTDKGLCRFDEERNYFRIYNTEEVQNQNFHYGASYKSNNGKIYFGGDNGLTIIDYQKIKINKNAPKVVLNSLKILQQHFPFKPINELSKIQLNYNQNTISASFSVIGYRNPTLYRYAYQLVGYDEDWNITNNLQELHYRNLKSGKYTLLLKGSNDDGYWSKPKSIEIVIYPPFWERWWFKIFSLIFLLSVTYLYYLYRLNKIQQQKRVLEFLVEERTNQLKEANTELKQTIEEVKAANEQIENQRNVLELTTIELEKKNKNITASISYAKRIQFAMLPSEEEMKKVFKQCFLYYKPRDIVSGDFYWMAIQRYNLDYERIFITVADCTGHGVPGAILSMVGNTLLTEAVNFKNLSEPVDILHEVNQGFIKMFKQDKNTIQDGMDIALCVIERSPNMEGKAILKFSGANNPLIIFQNNDLQEFKGDKKPIGGGDLFIKLNKPFTQKLIEINSPTMCYIFSDGFEDQFGGEENKKLTSKKFKQILNEIHHLDAQKQFEYLQNYMKNWMKNTNQLDDQLIIGFLI